MIVGLTIGCGGEDAPETTAEPSPDAEACEHLEQGPAQPIAAGSAADDSAPAVADDHRRYDITLADISGQNGGFVAFASSEAADWLFLFDRDVPVTFRDAAGAAIAPEETSASSADCPLVRGRHLVPLEVGTVYLELGPSTETSVSLVIEEAAGHEHE